MKVLDERKMGAVLVRWRPVCGMGLEKRKVMASGQRRLARRFLGKTWGGKALIFMGVFDIVMVGRFSVFYLEIY